MGSKLGDKLKELRKSKNLTAEDVSVKLKEMGYEIAGKTLSGYENGIRMPNADIFMALMSIYKCKDILGTFSFVEATYSIPSDEEWDVIEKFRTLDKQGKETVNYILDREYKLAEQIKKWNTTTTIELGGKSDTPARILQYFHSVSAGSGQVIFDDAYFERITIPDIPKYRRVAYAVKVSGHSMEPLYNDGDMLLIEPTCSIDVGEIGIFNVDGQAYVKKLGEGELISLNTGYDNVTLTDDSRCMGRVVDKFTNSIQ